MDLEEAEKTAKEISEKTGRKVIAIKTDCTDKNQVDEMVAQVVRELGGLDINTASMSAYIVNIPSRSVPTIPQKPQ